VKEKRSAMKNKNKKMQKKVLRSEKNNPTKEEKKSEIVKMRVKTKPNMDLKDSRKTKTKEPPKYH